jgi:hypothetical protein
MQSTTAPETVTSFSQMKNVYDTKVIVGLNNDLTGSSVLEIQVQESA